MIAGCEEASEDPAVSSAPNLVCAANPAVLPDLNETKLGEERTQMRLQKFGGEAAYRELSPTYQVRSGLPPTLLLHGDKDQVTLLDDTRRFAELMDAAGNTCTLVVYPGEGHGFFNYGDGANPLFAETTRELDRFLTAHAFLEGDSTIDSFRYSGPS
jgi:acetyl esterase/lipase